MEFEVTMVCTVRKLVTVQCEDEMQARNDPFGHAVYEQEIDQIDWEITKVVCTEKE